MDAVNCEICGAKPGRGGKILQHKKGCSLRKDQIKAAVTEVIEARPKTIPDGKTRCVQCKTPMRRVNCGGLTHRPEYSSCRHGRGLEVDCPECRQMQHGTFSWVCPQCKWTFDEGKAIPSANYEIRGEVKFDQL